MKRLMAAAVVLSGIAAAGVWFGLPVYAESQFLRSLDAWAASRPGGRATYADAALDYWAGQATLGSVTDVVPVSFGGETVLLFATVKGVVIDGYDFAAANRVAAGESPDGETIADRVGWQSIELVNEAGTLKASGGSGGLEGFAASAINPLNPRDAAGVRMAAFRQTPMQIAFSDGEGAIQSTVGDISARNLSNQGFDEISVGPVIVEVAAGQDGRADLVMGGMKAVGLVRGEPTTLALYESSGDRLSFDFPADAAAGMAPDEFEAERLKGHFSIGKSRLEGLRVDERQYALYRQVIDLFAEQDPARRQAMLPALGESAIQLLERAVELKTGLVSFSMEGVSLDMENIQNLTIASIKGRDSTGLRLGTVEILDQVQTDAEGNRITLERAVTRDGDLTALPAYLRKVFGSPVADDSLERARAFYRDNPIAAVIPAIDFGSAEYSGQRIELAIGQTLELGTIRMDAMKADEKGDITLAFGFDGITADLSALQEAPDPQAQMGFAILKSQGVEQLDMGFSMAVQFSPSDGELRINGVEIAEQHLASIGVNGLIGGIDVEKMRQLPPEARSSVLISAALSKLELTLHDLGGRDIAFNMMGGQSGASPEEMAFVLSLQAREQLDSLGTERASAIGRAAAAFMVSGGSLRLTANADQPLPVVQVMLLAQTEGPGALLDMLKVEAEHLPAE